MTYDYRFVALLLVVLPVGEAVRADDAALEHVIVTADFRERPVMQIPSSVTVLDAATIENAGVQHFEELVAYAPNLHFAGGSSRPRYFQIRGVGERQQYEGAPNPSVGFLVDDIDFSGVGMVATLFDVAHIEVLRGPQGTRYGANALAGIINLRTREPGAVFDAHAEVTAGSDAALAAGVAFGGPLGGSTGYRISTHHYQSNGFRDNLSLGRDDTNRRNETSLRAKLTGVVGNVDYSATLLHADIDNGYDAFAIDNSLSTLSDKPGKDTQRSTGAALTATWGGDARFEVTSITTGVDSDIEHRFDGDWGSDDSWGVFAPYDFTSDNRRTRSAVSQELRILSTPQGALFNGRTDWLAGVYVHRLDEDNALLDLFNGDVFRLLDSTYEATSRALFAEIDMQLSDNGTLGIGARVERRDARYVDSAGAAFDPNETMSGGHLAYTYSAAPERSWYLRLARGYKAGGFNIDISIPEERREFDTETLLNYEAGLRSLWRDGALELDLALFYSLRDDQQVRTSTQLIPGDPVSFVFFTDNAASGRNVGLEGRVAWRLDDRWRLHGTVGLLDTRFDSFGDPSTGSIAGRDQAHAPEYQFTAGVEYRDPRGWFARADLAGVDAFYFSDSHNERSDSYTLTSARVGYRSERWSATLWGRNIFDETYAVRGFFFGNEPPDFADKLYIQRGDPQHFGLTVAFSL